jgi:DNA polymerase-3 subunit delta
VKASKASIARLVDQPDPAVRFYLFHGADEAGSRALAERLLEALGATKSSLQSSSIKADPASLADAAGAMSLFGGKQAIWIEPATKDIEEGVTALLEGAAAENAVIAIAGALNKTSALLKMADASPAALAYVSYAPEGRDAAQLVVDLGRRVGLNKINSSVAARLAAACGNDRAVIGRELEKLALFLDASPQTPKELDHHAIDEVGADSSEGGFNHLADLAMTGDLTRLADELAALSPAGTEAIPVIRSRQRRLLMLAPLRARVERGESPDGVMTSMGKSLFWKDKAAVSKMLSSWSAAKLATVSDRATALERAVMLGPGPDREALGEELLAIARAARGR